MRAFSFALLAALASSALALDSSCLSPSGSTVPQNVDITGSVSGGLTWNCAKLRVDSGANVVKIPITQSLIDSVGAGATLQAVFWNLEADVSAASIWVSAADIANNQVFAIAPTGTNLTALKYDPATLGTSVSPGNFNFNGNYFAQSAGGTTTIIGMAATSSNLCAGTYYLLVNTRGLAKSGTVGLLWRVVSAASVGRQYTITTNGPTVSVMDSWWPVTATTFSSVSFSNTDDWAVRRYMLKEASATIRTLGAALPANSSVSLSITAADGTGAWDGSPEVFVPAQPTGTGAQSYKTFSWSATGEAGPANAFQYSVLTGTPSEGRAVFAVDATVPGPTITTSAEKLYDWRAAGPFVTFSLQFTGTAWPFITGPTAINFNLGTSRYTDRNALYMLRSSDPLDYLITGTASNVRLTTVTDGVITPGADDGYITVLVLKADGTTTQTLSGGSLPTPAATATLQPTLMSTYYTAGPASNPLAGQPQTNNLPVQWAASSGQARDQLYFIQFGVGSCVTSTGAGNSLTATVAPVVANAKIECSSNADCNGVTGDVHPAAARAANSSNGDSSRFATCYLIANYTGFNKGVLSTRCMECAPARANRVDFECNEGQYCHIDRGLCNDGTNVWPCDQESASYLGMCRNKKWLGSRCRPVATSSLGSGPTVNRPPSTSASSTISPAAIGAVFGDPQATSSTGYAPGGGFCGEVRAYNETGLGYLNAVSSDNQMNVKGLARSVLWTGSCVMGRCYECNPSTLPSDDVASTGKTCVNGRYVTVATNDWTPRTLANNAMGQAGAVTAAFLVILMGMVLVGMQDAANRHRELFGEEKMSTMEAVRAIFCLGFLPCCKTTSERIHRAPYIHPASAPLTGGGKRGTIDSGSAVANPLSGSAAAHDWAA